MCPRHSFAEGLLISSLDLCPSKDSVHIRVGIFLSRIFCIQAQCYVWQTEDFQSRVQPIVLNIAPRQSQHQFRTLILSQNQSAAHLCMAQQSSQRTILRKPVRIQCQKRSHLSLYIEIMNPQKELGCMNLSEQLNNEKTTKTTRHCRETLNKLVPGENQSNHSSSGSRTESCPLAQTRTRVLVPQCIALKLFSQRTQSEYHAENVDFRALGSRKIVEDHLERRGMTKLSHSPRQIKCRVIKSIRSRRAFSRTPPAPGVTSLQVRAVAVRTLRRCDTQLAPGQEFVQRAQRECAVLLSMGRK